MASNYDTTNIKVFDNKILEEKLESQLITALDMNGYITTDYSLSAKPGMKIEIHTYHGSGDVEDVEMGEGNTGNIGANYTSEEYEVTTTQGRVPYYDEQQMNDPTAIDKAIQHLSEQLTNDITTKVIAELDKATLTMTGPADFSTVVKAIATLPQEKNDGLFLMIARKDYADWQIALRDDLKYVEDFVRTGYIGHVAGVPVVMTDAVESGTAYLATREAVTCFVKKGVEVEQERAANTRQTTIYGRNVKVIALTNADKVIKITIGTEDDDVVVDGGDEDKGGDDNNIVDLG